MDALPIFGNRNRDCARKRLDCWLISSRTTFGQLSTVVDSPVTAVTALSLIDCLTWGIIQPYISNALIIRVVYSLRQLARSARNLTGQDNSPVYWPFTLLRRPRLYAIRLKVLLGDAQIHWPFIVPT